MRRRWSCSFTMLVLAAMAGTAMPALAGDVSYTATHVFTLNDVQCDRGVTGTVCLDLANPVLGSDGLLYYPIDSAYGWNVKDFDPAALLPRPRDGIYAEGAAATLTDATGQAVGITVQNPETADWKAGSLGGEWVMGLGALKAKTSTEQYVVMDHILNAPWMPPLIEGVDYSSRLKDDGKVLYFWGNYNKEPTPVYLSVRIPLPEAWKQAGADFALRSASLIISHKVTNSPNDQIRPEDFENELATGILPSYTVASDGTWISSVDSYEGGDGEFLPAGTVLRDAAGVFTNAWYVTLDRDPFGGTNPRWRLKSGKFGQNLPGVEIPQYPVGTPTTTMIDLLAPMKDPVTGAAGPSLLARSINWNAYLDGNDGSLDGLTIEDCMLTPDFDLMLYIKGEVGKPTPLYSARLDIVYDDPSAVIPQPEPVPAVDLAISGIEAPNKVSPGSPVTLTVAVMNMLPGAAEGILTLNGTDKDGSIVGRYELAIATNDDMSPTLYGFGWTATSYSTVVSWQASVTAPGDVNAANNSGSTNTLVK